MARSKHLDPQPPPAPLRRDSEQIVEAIIQATLTAGDPEISINEIAERAGVGIASVYRYFSNKPAIYAEISRRLQREFLSRLRVLLARPDLDVDQGIEAICRLAVVVPNASAELRRMLNLVLPMSWSEDSAREIFETAMDELVAWFVARVPAPPDDVAIRVFIAFSAVRGAVTMSQLLPSRAPEQEVLIRHLAACTRIHLGLEVP